MSRSEDDDLEESSKREVRVHHLFCVFAHRRFVLTLWRLCTLSRFTRKGTKCSEAAFRNNGDQTSVMIMPTQRDFFAPFEDRTTQWSTVTVDVHGKRKEERQTFMFEVISFFIIFLRTKGSEMKKRTKEELKGENPVVYAVVWLSLSVCGVIRYRFVQVRDPIRPFKDLKSLKYKLLPCGLLPFCRGRKPDHRRRRGAEEALGRWSRA